MFLEFFIEPVGGRQRYELNGWPAVTAFERLAEWITAGSERGTVSPASADARAVPTEVVLRLIEGVGGQWYRGTSGQGAKGDPVEVEAVIDDLRHYELHEVSFYEI